MKNPNKISSPGFTLIELIVAMAITSIIVTILIKVTAISIDTWNRSRAEIRATRQAKAMIDSMAQDLESLVIRKGNNFEWLNATSLSSTNAPGPDGKKSPNAANFFFFSAATDRYDGNVASGDGDVSAIAYQLRYKDPINDQPQDSLRTFVLYRKIVDPDDAFTSLLGQAKLDVAFTNLLGAGSGPNSIDAVQNFICDNVYQFTITFHVEATIAGVTRTYPISIGQGSNQYDNLFITGSGISSLNPPASPLIDATQLKAARVATIELSLTVLTDFGLNQMRGRTFTDTAAFDAFVNQNSFQYSKVITVPSY